MRVSREQAAENRRRIVDAAARLFRDKGFDGVGVDAIMKSAGLTHGGFYGHFESKNDLAVEACTRALDTSVQKWNALIETAADPLKAITESYLSVRHRDRPGDGCVISALGTDVARQDKSVRRVVTKGLEDLVDRFGVHEMLISTRAHGTPAKLRSMELIAGAFALPGRVAA